MKKKEIRDTIEGLGYKIDFRHGTRVLEHFVSKIDGEVLISCRCWSSKRRDYDFLESIISEKNLKGL